MATPAAEEYLRAFYYLEKKNGSARPKELSDYLKVSKPGVSEMLRSLGGKGLFYARRYGPVRLTKKGLALAKKMTFRHRVLEFFLANRLSVPVSRVHDEASRMEHAISDDTVRRLYKFLGKPKSDPHGQPIEGA